MKFAKALPQKNVKFSSGPCNDLEFKLWPQSDRFVGEAVIKIVNKESGSRSDKDRKAYMSHLFPSIFDTGHSMTWKSLPKHIASLKQLDPIDFEAESDDYKAWPSQMLKRAQAVKSLAVKASGKQTGVYVRRIFPKDFSGCEKHYECLKKILGGIFDLILTKHSITVML